MTWPTYPTPTNCRGGTAWTSLPVAVGPRNPAYFATRTEELSRKAVGTEDGSVIVLGCSFGNYIPMNRLSPFAIDYTITGTDLRKVLRMIADDSTMGWYYNGAYQGYYSVKGIGNWSNAGGVVIYGLIQNHLNQEALGGYTATESIASATLMLEKIAAWLTGPLVIYECTPVRNNNGNPGITNANIDAVNSAMATIFGSRADTVLIQNASAFKDVNGELDVSYSLDGLHLNADAIDIQVTAGRIALATFGLTG